MSSQRLNLQQALALASEKDRKTREEEKVERITPQFTCFTSTEVQILTPDELGEGRIPYLLPRSFSGVSICTSVGVSICTSVLYLRAFYLLECPTSCHAAPQASVLVLLYFCTSKASKLSRNLAVASEKDRKIREEEKKRALSPRYGSLFSRALERTSERLASPRR